MSNPSRAPRETSEMIDRKAFLPDCHYKFLYEEPAAGEKLNRWRKESKEITSLTGLVDRLANLDMQVAEPFVVPKELTLDAAALNSDKPLRACAKKAALATRPRTKVAKTALELAYKLLPDGIKEEVYDRSKVLALVDAGAEYTIGRFEMAYPKKGSRITHPISREEAEWGWETEVGRHLGSRSAALEMREAGKLEPLPLWGEEGSLTVHTNRNATTGFPVLANAREEEVMHLVQRITTSVEEELTAALARDEVGGVEKWIRKAERERPFLVALQGKAKADFYKEAKAEQRQLRFYNSMPRHMSMLVQSASQVLERESKSIVDDNRCHSASGTAMNHGGMRKLVEALDAQCLTEQEGHSRMGDDSFCAIVVEELGSREGNPFEWVTVVYLFALDASNFDLTQHADLTFHPHAVLFEILSVIKLMSAQILHAYQRARLVVLMLTLNYVLKHGGPSGLPLQSKVNGVIMGVAIRRLFAELRRLNQNGTPLSEEIVARAIKKVGDGMGLVVRLEQFVRVELRSTQAERAPVSYALSQTKFLYLGYHFYNEAGVVCGHADMARTIAQMRYPALGWVAEKEQLHGLEVGRLAATFLAWGRPTRDLRPAFDAIRAHLLDSLAKILAQGGNIENPKLVWNTQMSALMAPEEMEDGTEDKDARASLKGLYRTLSRSYDDLWLQDSDEVSTASEFSDEEQEETSFLPPASSTSLDLVKFIKKAPSRAPTKKTAGRNPNTKVFAPALPPRNPMSRLHENAGWSRERVDIQFGSFADEVDEEAELPQEEEFRRAQEEAERAVERDEADRERARQAAEEARLARMDALSDDEEDYFRPANGEEVDQDEAEYRQGLQQAAHRQLGSNPFST